MKRSTKLLALTALLAACETVLEPVQSPREPREVQGAVIAAPAAATVSSGLFAGATRRITTDPAWQISPAIAGDLIVWADTRLGGANIFMLDLTTGIEGALTTDPSAQYSDPDVDGNLVVWTNRTTPFGTFLLDLSTGVQRRLSSDFAEWARVSGQRVVWGVAGGGSFDIRMMDLAAGVTRTIAGGSLTQRNPAISGDRIVWHTVHSGTSDISMMDLATGRSMAITSDPGFQHFADIDGDRIVWTDHRTGDGEIFMYDVATRLETQLTDQPGTVQGLPRISGDLVVWWDNRNGDFEIYAMDLITGAEANLTADPDQQSGPAISGNRVVWYDFRTGNLDIFMTSLIRLVEFEALREAINDLVASEALRAGQAIPLLKALDGAVAHLTASRTGPAAVRIENFVQVIGALVKGGALTEAQAEPLIDAARSIADRLGG